MKLCMHCFHKLTEEDAVCPHCHKNTEESAPVHHLKPGTVLMDRYVVGHALGEGGFGITYIGWDETLKMRVAIKEYFPNGFSVRNHNVSDTVELTKGKVGLDFRGEMDRFLQEAQRLAKFSGKPGVVSIYNYFQANNTAYIVMEFLDGVTLMTVLRQNNRLSPDVLFSALDPVMQALEMIHSEKLIHRDISPDNIMVLRDNTLKLLDFGAAREVSGGHSLSVVLKPGYAPEEQYRTKGIQGPWTDIYALCATMYKCLTGITPSVSLDRAAEDDLQKPSQLGIAITPTQEAALMKGLSVRMKHRFQTVRELRIALGLAKEEESIHSTHLFSVDDNGGGSTQEKDTKTTKTAKTTKTTKSKDGKKDAAGDSNDTGVTVYDNGTSTEISDRDTDIKRRRNRSRTDEAGGKRLPKKLIFLILAVIAAVAAITLIVGALKAPREILSPIEGNDSYTVSPVGQITGELKFDDDVVYRKAGDLRQLIDLNGKAVLDANFTNIRYLQDDLYLVRNTSGDVNNLHLISRDGQRYWDTPAAMANWITYTDTHHRYLLVSFAEEVTTDPEKCFLSRTENNLYYTTPMDNATMYTGYALAYDLDQMRFVPNLPGISNISSVEVCGDSLLWGESHSALSLWNAEGESLDQPEGSVHVGDGYYLVYANTTYRIYDQEGNQTYASNKAVSVIANSGLFQIRTDDGTKIPIDPWGNPLFTTGYESFDGLICGNLLVRQDGKYGLLSLTGEVVVPIKYDHISQINDWYYYTRYGDKYTLFSPEGIIATDLDRAPSELIVDTDDRALVLNKRETYVDVSGGHKWLTDALITVCDSFNGLYGAADLFAGVRILPCEYEQIHYAAGYLYAYKNGAWDVFELTYHSE